MTSRPYILPELAIVSAGLLAGLLLAQEKPGQTLGLSYHSDRDETSSESGTQDGANESGTNFDYDY